MCRVKWILKNFNENSHFYVYVIINAFVWNQQLTAHTPNKSFPLFSDSSRLEELFSNGSIWNHPAMGKALNYLSPVAQWISWKMWTLLFPVLNRLTLKLCFNHWMTSNALLFLPTWHFPFPVIFFSSFSFAYYSYTSRFQLTQMLYFFHTWCTFSLSSIVSFVITCL